MTTATLSPPSKRMSTSTSAPALSVVMASVNGWETLGATLRSIDALPERGRIEVIVVDRVGGTTRDRLNAHRPAVNLIANDDRLSIPRLRYRGVCQSRGDLVAILEDHAEVDPAWASALIDAHAGPWGAVGGPVENGKTGWINDAGFLCEYAAYMAPVPDGESSDLPGNNIAYKRDDLLRHAHLLDEGKWESWINDRLRNEGIPLASAAGAVVRHIKPFRLGNFLTQRFHFSRSYAGMRRPDQSVARRLIYGLGSAILPALLLARTARTAASKGRLGEFARCLPLLALFFVVGAIGEMVGYLIGPGRSLDRVE